jgi:hypothetical protein
VKRLKLSTIRHAAKEINTLVAVIGYWTMIRSKLGCIQILINRLALYYGLTGVQEPVMSKAIYNLNVGTKSLLGKTYLALVLINACKKDQSWVTYYFYCKEQKTKGEKVGIKNSAIIILCGILLQLVF